MDLGVLDAVAGMSVVELMERNSKRDLAATVRAQAAQILLLQQEWADAELRAAKAGWREGDRGDC